MPCNLNFNQCNSFRNYPRPIFNCYRNLISLLNQSGNTIVNPIIETASSISEIAVPQAISFNGNVISTQTFSQGSAITYDNAGRFTLIFGRYLVTYNLNGILSTNGTNSYGIYLDNNLIPSSISSVSGTPGGSSMLSNSVFINITSPTGEVTIKNSNSQSQILNSGSITIQKIV